MAETHELSHQAVDLRQRIRKRCADESALSGKARTGREVLIVNQRRRLTMRRAAEFGELSMYCIFRVEQRYGNIEHLFVNVSLP